MRTLSLKLFKEHYPDMKVTAWNDISGKKSVTIRLSIGSMTRTLKTEEITECANAVIKRLTKTLGGVLRG